VSSGSQVRPHPGRVSECEAALFRFLQVKTLTHLVQSNAEIRVSYLEGVAMERALKALEIPPSFRLFPGKGRGLGKNPWPGCIWKWFLSAATREPL
jgi:hypothetical protein